MVALAAGRAVVGVGLAPQLFAVAQRPGVRPRRRAAGAVYNLLVAVLAAVTVTVAMRTVGLLLVSALMVVPVATSQQLTRSFRTTLAGAMVVGMARVWAALLSASLSFRAMSRPARPSCCCRWPCFVVDLADRGVAPATPPAAGALPRASRRCASTEPPTSTPTSTGTDCGHPAVPHGDHVDYVHDGHRHAPHGEHYDEH